MNKEKLKLAVLEKIEYGSSNGMFFHPEFIDELGEVLLKHSQGSEKEALKKFLIIIEQVKVAGRRIDSVDGHELLKQYVTGTDCYSLHLKTKQINARLLVTFSDRDVPMFIGAFNEKRGKKDYADKKEIFKNRLENMEVDVL